MDELTEYPQNAVVKRTHRGLKITLGSIAAVAVIVAGVFIAAPMIATAQQTAHIAALAKAQADVPAAPLGDATTADEQTTLDQSDADGAQAIVTEQRVEAAAAAELAAQQAAAAQAAVQAAEAAKDHHTASTNDQGLPAGAVPPDVPGTDEPDSTACASSALTWNGTESVCD